MYKYTALRKPGFTLSAENFVKFGLLQFLKPNSMISAKETTRVSKFLSLVLRHQPETLGIHLDENGWTDVPVLLEKLNAGHFAITFEDLKHVVDTNEKKRFAFNDDATRIRASQGHSVSVELDYTPQVPPAELYHGSAEGNVPSILASGLDKRSRHHVHLSADPKTAVAVGQRHGKPVVFTVASGRMHADGFVFFQSDNQVWLTDHVPPAYLQIPS